MIYCVVPQALADELYDKLVKYYEDDPNVTVIVDRRSPTGPGAAQSPAQGPARRQRDRQPSGADPQTGVADRATDADNPEAGAEAP